MGSLIASLFFVGLNRPLPLLLCREKSVCSVMSLSEIGRLIVNDCDSAEWIFGEQKVILERGAENLVSKVIFHDGHFWCEY